MGRMAMVGMVIVSVMMACVMTACVVMLHITSMVEDTGRITGPQN